MAEFILEDQINNVLNKNTKDYLREVISSYNNGNYRAAIVVLYTTVIYDLLQKIVVLKEIYNDKGAEKIINEIMSQQNNNPKRSEWEGDLIENVYKETKLISAVEKEELIHLKNERNYAAHPIVNIDNGNENLELKHIRKETARDLIRKAFEIVFLRDAILAKNIVKDIVCDLNEFYERVNTDGLEDFLNLKYFRRMSQERKDDLFKSLWKFVFILNDVDCNKNREANYWGLKFLYNENKNHYRNLVKREGVFFFDNLKLETLKSWNEEYGTDGNSYILYTFRSQSRIMSFIRFLENAPEMYKELNEYARNIVRQSIDHMYIDEDVIETPIYKSLNKNSNLFEEQVKLKSKTVFLSDDISNHFTMIFKMINNYKATSSNWTEPNNYCVLDESDLEIILYQSEHRGSTDYFLNFLIDYCTGADQFWQASHLFSNLKKFSKHFKEEHYYMILQGMNENSQFHSNRDKLIFVNELEKMYMDNYGNALVNDKVDKYLYSNLYSVKMNSDEFSVEKILLLIEKRAVNYSSWNLRNLLFTILDSKSNIEFLKQQNASMYPNILSIFGNTSDPNYSKNDIDHFNKYFDFD